jgi:NADH:ubiquinone oxidoreductase subunit 4 (subunit M)
VVETEVATACDLRPRELAILLAFALFVLGASLYPTPILEVIRTAAEALVSGTQ